MKIVNQVPVSASVQETWRTLLDVPRVARALPGASIEPDLVDGAYRGRMKIKLGPVTAEYAGLARLQDSDEDDHIASFHVQGREVRGQGTAEATITIRVSAGADATRLEVQTDLQVTGRQAQIGRGIMEEVAAGVLREFASRLERAIVGSEALPGAGDEAVFDAGGAVYRPLLERGAILLVGVLLGLGLGRALRRQ
jgi:uncharacterized protein